MPNGFDSWEIQKMAVTRFRFSLLIFMTLIAVGQAEAWSCGEPDVVFLENRENALTEAEILRHRSIAIAARLPDTLVDGDKIVVGRFKRNEPTPLLHEDQLDQIRAMYWPPTKDVKMPYSIEYTYFGVFSFTGHEIDGATLVPFAASRIDAQVSISAEYEGVVDALPTTENNVIGVLRTGRNEEVFELTTNPCSSYFQISQEQLSDLMQCYSQGLC